MSTPPETRIVVLDGYTLSPLTVGQNDGSGEPTWDALAAEGTLIVHPRSRPGEVLDRARGARIILTNKVVLGEQQLEALPELRFVGILATGTNVVDLTAARNAGVTVSNSPAYGSDSVAQHVFALILELSQQTSAHDRAVRSGQWVRSPDFSFTVAPTVELAGKTLGIVGLGAIGRRVAAVGHALGMRIAAAHQSSMHRVELAHVPVEWCPMDTLFAKADVLTLHCPLTESTQQLVNSARLRLMKPSALLINTGRGGLIDEAALSAALRAGRLRGAGVDVLSTEPPAAENPLLSAPHCVITPHIAWATRESRQRLMGIAVENVRAFLAGAPINVVT